MKFDFFALKDNLERKGYSVAVFETKEDAAKYLDCQINGKVVGFGGSVTLREMNLFELLASHNTVYTHDKKTDNLSVMETRTAACRADVYISSVNAISQQGEIVNIDNTGNRVAAISYGPTKVYLIIGSNKITENLESAIFRARNIAAPLNAKRLNRKTPCAEKADRCYDCQCADRICRNLSIFLTMSTGVEYEIILIDEKLGF